MLVRHTNAESRTPGPRQEFEYLSIDVLALLLLLLAKTTTYIQYVKATQKMKRERLTNSPWRMTSKLTATILMWLHLMADHSEAPLPYKSLHPVGKYDYVPRMSLRQHHLILVRYRRHK